MQKIIFALHILTILDTAYGRPDGAPLVACTDMTPRHGVGPQTTTFPYIVTPSAFNVSPGQTITFIITGQLFRGFLIEVRKTDDPLFGGVGVFNISATDLFSKAINCQAAKQSAATHKSPIDKPMVMLTWTAPNEVIEKLTVYITVVKIKPLFWVAQKPINLTMH